MFENVCLYILARAFAEEAGTIGYINPYNVHTLWVSDSVHIRLCIYLCDCICVYMRMLLCTYGIKCQQNLPEEHEAIQRRCAFRQTHHTHTSLTSPNIVPRHPTTGTSVHARPEQGQEVQRRSRRSRRVCWRLKGGQAGQE